MREYYFKVEYGVKGLECFRVKAEGLEEAILKVKRHFNNDPRYDIYMVNKDAIDDSQKIQEL